MSASLGGGLEHLAEISVSAQRRGVIEHFGDLRVYPTPYWTLPRLSHVVLEHMGYTGLCCDTSREPETYPCNKLDNGLIAECKQSIV